MSFGGLEGPLLDTEQIVALKNAADALKKLTKCLVSVGEDSLAIIPRLQLPLHPEDIDDYSEDDAEMQTQTDPYPGESLSHPTYLTGELERIRYQLAQIMGNTHWYEDPATTIAYLKTLAEGHATRHLKGGEDAFADGSIDPDLLATVPYSKLDLADSIVNADIAAGAAIAWSKIAVDPNVCYDDVAETIALRWTFDGGIRMGSGDSIEFYDDDGDYRGRMLAYGDELRILAVTTGTPIRFIQATDTYVKVEVETYGGAGGILPDGYEEGKLGDEYDARWLYPWELIVGKYIKDSDGTLGSYSLRDDLTDLRRITELKDPETGEFVTGSWGNRVIDAATLPHYIRGKKGWEARVPNRGYISGGKFKGWLISLLKRIDANQQDIQARLTALERR